MQHLIGSKVLGLWIVRISNLLGSLGKIVARMAKLNIGPSKTLPRPRFPQLLYRQLSARLLDDLANHGCQNQNLMSTGEHNRRQMLLCLYEACRQFGAGGKTKYER